MSFLAAIPIIGNVIDGIFGTIDKLVLDKDEAAKLKAEIQLQTMKLDYGAFEAEINARSAIIQAEAKGESWTQRNWRPILMLSIVAIIVNNYLVFPYMDLFGYQATLLELPDRMWGLMEIGVGGYVLGRSGEKIITQVFKKPTGGKE
jgi:hypothetical protein